MAESSGAKAPCTLRRPGAPETVEGFTGVQIDDPRLEDAIRRDTPLLRLFGQAVHGEGPLWQPEKGRLLWSDIPLQRVMAWYPDGRVEVAIPRTHFINANALDHSGRLVHCEHGRRCISRSEGDGAPVPLVTHFEDRRLNTPNDVTVAADGAIWFTDPVFGMLNPQQGCLGEPDLDHRSVYRFDEGTGDLRRMADFEQPNGLFFSPDGRTLYVSDTARSIGGPTHDVLAFDVGAEGALTNRRFFCRTDHGVPDGVAVDRRGWLWCTAGDGIHVYAPDATRLGFIPTPTTAGNCAFGGADGTRLFIAAEKNLFALDLEAPAF